MSDRDDRRRAVVEAATELLDEVGWAGFSIRAIAGRAGVSTGAVYQWFSGKDEIFGEIYLDEIRRGLDLIERVPADQSLPETVRMMLDWTVALFERLGRYELEFVEASRDRAGRRIAPTMPAAYLELARAADERLDAAAARDGVRLVHDERRIAWFWSACVGCGERIVAERHFADPDLREWFLDFCTDSLVRSLTA